MLVLSGIAFLLWYLFVTLAGLTVLPLSYRLLPHLGDRGFALARPLGLLVWGYIFWLLTSLHVLQNDAGGILLALLITAAISYGSLRMKNGQISLGELWGWVKAHRNVLITSEVIFVVVFAAWAFVRATNPEITGTEKPMEQAFINAILRSPTFPPHDPWLSDYAISYYYFGYVMVAMLAKITGVNSGVTFNLASALWFAMSAQAAYGILYSLLQQRLSSLAAIAASRAERMARSWAGLAPLFLLLVSNLEGFLEVLHARGLFWQRNAEGVWQSAFWRWLDVQELVNAPTEPFGWAPERIGGIWWWRASRVLQDYSLAMDSKEIIDEFPFFSYLLADLHPHVLAMPFALLAVALSLNFYQHIRLLAPPAHNFIDWLKSWGREEKISFHQTRLGSLMTDPVFWLAVLALGGLGFLNTWDFPIYVGLFSAAYVLARYQVEGWAWQRIVELAELAIMLMLLGVALYLPFYLSFSSQAGGPLPSLSFFTRGTHLWLMFGSLLIPIFAWLAYLWVWRGGRAALSRGFQFGSIVIGGLWALSYLLSWAVLALMRDNPQFSALRGLFLQLQGGSSGGALLLESLLRRFAQPGGWLTLFALVALVWGLLYTFRPKPPADNQDMPPEGGLLTPTAAVTGNSFVLLLILLGAGLVIFPEFFYLRDQFGWRMNTIFKFYYQAWLVWSIAAAYAVTVLLTSLKGIGSWVVRAVWMVVLLASLVYPFFGILDRVRHLRPAELTLNGNAWMEQFQPDEIAAITWLRSAPLGNLAEAVGGSYSAAARVSALSGQPAVLGWPGHESQWRGGAAEMGTRETDLELLYRTARWEDALAIIQKYNIRYIYIGAQEYSSYRVNADKFAAHLFPAFTSGTVVVYDVSEAWIDLPVSTLPGSGYE